MILQPDTSISKMNIELAEMIVGAPQRVEDLGVVTKRLTNIEQGN